MCVKYEIDENGVVWGVKKSGAFFRVSEKKIRELIEKGKLVYPNYDAPVITQDPEGRHVDIMRFGVWPFYEKVKPRRVVQNARDDSLLTKTIWKQSIAKRRCLIPLAAYFEAGNGPPGAMGNVRFTIRDRPSIFCAGVWDRDPDGSGNCAFAMVTTAPNETAARWHDRMPVVLDDADSERWIGHEPLADDILRHLCRGQPAEVLMPFEIPAPPKTKKITKNDLQAAPNEQGELLF